MEFLNIKPVNFSENAYMNTINLNGKKYSDLGMSIEQLSMKLGIPETIVSTYDNWYVLDDGFYYLKKRAVFLELFISEIARRCGIRCVNFTLASDSRNEIGIISKLYREKDKQYYSYDEFCMKFFGNVKNDLSYFMIGSSLVFGDDKKNLLMDDIFGIISLGLFSGQWDQGFQGDNLFFEYDSTTGPRIAPLCDVSGCFSLGFDYESPFGKFSLCSEDTSVLDKQFLYLLRYEASLYNKLQSFMDVDINGVIDYIVSTYCVLLEEDERTKILNYFDKRKNVIGLVLKDVGRSK